MSATRSPEHAASDPATPALRLRGIRSGYGEAAVVNGVDLEVRRGEIFALLGKNGMGKSTLLKTVMGFLPMRGGHVELFGESVDGLPPHRIARRAIAYTPQEQALFQDLTVRENLRFFARVLGAGGDAVEPVAEIALPHLDDAVAALAEQMVVVRVAAEPVALLGAVVGEDVDDAALAQKRERAVDGGQARARVALAEPRPELLRGRVVPLAGELLEHLEPPRCRTDALALEQLDEVLRCA